MAMKIKLVGCERYNFRGELYEAGKVYLVGNDKAELMLRAVDDFDRPYFVEYRKPTKSAAQKEAEAAAAAALAAAQAEEALQVIERPDGSEPDPAPAEPDAEAPVEIDTDDDPELDGEDVVNPEALDLEVEEDRDDPEAVQV